MEINFKQKLTEDFLKLKTDKEKRVYLEMINFFAEADENDYRNYYTHKILNDSDFYSVVDILYNLDNFYMLEDFLARNKNKFTYKEYCNNKPFCDISDGNINTLIKRYFKTEDKYAKIIWLYLFFNSCLWSDI